jgi:hypothetical protein
VKYFLSSNGYVVFADIETLYTGADLIATLDMPTLAAHFALPRISFMFHGSCPAHRRRSLGQDYG